MNRFISILLGILVFLISFMPYETMAQNTTKTAYQKRLEQIDKELAQKFGYSEPNDIVGLELMNGMAEYLKGRNTSRAKIYLWYINEQEKAKKLKTQADFDREKREQEAALAQKKEAEAKRAAKMEELRLKCTDYYEVIDEIKKDFEKWSQKGEFESSTAYEERLKSKSESQFYNICSDNITTRYKRLSIRGELQQYNADNQYFPVKIYFDPGYYQKDRYLNMNIPVSVENAPEFKNNYKKDAWHPKCDIGNLVFVDNYLVLKKVSYSGKEYELPLEKYTEVKFAFKDLGIQNSYCQNAVFHLNMIENIKEEQRKEQQMLVQTNCEKYNRKLDSIVSMYNQKLLQEEYNFDSTTISYSPLECGPGIEEKFAVAKRKLEEKYNSFINDVFVRYKDCINHFIEECFDNIKNFVIEEEGCADKKHHCHCLIQMFRGTLDYNNNYGHVSCYEVENKIKEMIVDINTQLNSEWTKNGQYFESKIDFFNTYLKFISYHSIVVINSEYETILYNKLPESERQRYDSIACIEYNHKLDSIITTYNRELLQNEYNFPKSTIETHNLECGQGIEKRFSEAKKDIDNKFNKIKAVAETAKQRIQDSIACVGYNKQLDSIVAIYNKELLQHEYNLEKKTIQIQPLELISGKKNQEFEKRFNNEQNDIKGKYSSIIADANNNKKIVEDYKQTNFNELVSFKFENYNNHDIYNNCPGYLTRNIANASAYNSRYSSALVEKLMEVTVDINTQLNNEWTKNGQYFENKVDFFNSFVKFWPYNVVSINPDYKTILKEKKKAKK